MYGDKKKQFLEASRVVFGMFTEKRRALFALSVQHRCSAVTWSGEFALGAEASTLKHGGGQPLQVIVVAQRQSNIAFFQRCLQTKPNNSRLLQLSVSHINAYVSIFG